jgi:ribosomal protein S17
MDRKEERKKLGGNRMEDKNKIEIITGIFRNPRKVKEVGVVISLKNKKAIVMNRKAMWSLLRVHFHRAIDKEVKDQKRLGISLEDFFLEAFKIFKGKRKPMQFFLKGNKCMACATMKHPTTTSEEVYKIFNKALKKQKLKLEEKEGITGKILILQKTKIASFGLNINTGDIYTGRAIRISTYVEILQCLNPLSFAGLSMRQSTSQIQPIKARILRFESLTRIPDRIGEAIAVMKPELIKIETRLDETKKIAINPNQAMTLITAFGCSYGLGAKPLKKAYDRFIESEQKSLFGLAMACSYIVEHKPEIFRKNANIAKTNLATIAGAILLINKLPQTVESCKKFVKHEPVAQVIEARILGKLPIGRVRKNE